MPPLVDNPALISLWPPVGTRVTRPSAACIVPQQHATVPGRRPKGGLSSEVKLELKPGPPAFGRPGSNLSAESGKFYQT